MAQDEEKKRPQTKTLLSELLHYIIQSTTKAYQGQVKQKMAEWCLLTVRNADCCRYCKHTGVDFTFRNAVLCYKTNNYQSHTDVCDEYKEIEE